MRARRNCGEDLGQRRTWWKRITPTVPRDPGLGHDFQKGLACGSLASGSFRAGVAHGQLGKRAERSWPELARGGRKEGGAEPSTREGEGGVCGAEGERPLTSGPALSVRARALRPVLG